MREIRFVINDKELGFLVIETVDAPLEHRGAHNFKGYEVSNGYILRKVKGHPNATKRGYYQEHRLVVEESLKRLLYKDEVVHHIDGNRRNNELSNLKVVTQANHAGIEHVGKRNPNGTIAASDPMFEQIKFRLHDVDRGITSIFTLSKLISTTFRRGKFQFRGRFTGLKDKNGKEIWEGDVVQWYDDRVQIQFLGGSWSFEYVDSHADCLLPCPIFGGEKATEVIGNVWEHPDLLKS